MLFYSNRKAHPFSISDVPIYKSIFHLLQAPPVTVYKPLFFNVSSTILMTAHIFQGFRRFSFSEKFLCSQACSQTGIVLKMKNQLIFIQKNDNGLQEQANQFARQAYFLKISCGASISFARVCSVNSDINFNFLLISGRIQLGTCS